MAHRVQARLKGALIWVPVLVLVVWILGAIKQFLEEGGLAILSVEALPPWKQGYLFLNFLLLIPLVISIRNSWRTGSEDYWFLVIVFVGYMGWNITEAFWTALDLPSAHILYRLLALFGEFATIYLVLHFLRLGWKEVPRRILVLILGLFVYYLGTLLLEFFAFGVDGIPIGAIHAIPILWLPNKVWPLLTEFPSSLFAKIVIVASFQSVFYLFGLYTYRTLRPASPTKRIQTVINLWTLFILARFIEMVLLAVTNFPAIIWGPGAVPWSGPIHVMINNLLRIVAILAIFYVAVRYPEAMLITHTQLLRATKLYELFQVSQEPDIDLRQDQLLSYISSFPPELLAELHQA